MLDLKITIFGTGYVGLVTGACLADAGHNVICMDVDKSKIDGLKKGLIPIFEPGLDVIVSENYRSGRINFTTNAEEAVNFGELQFIAVGTPSDEDGSADLSYVLRVAKSIAEHMSSPKIIVNKSTVPVGTADEVKKIVSEGLKLRNYEVSFEVCSNPEFLKEGSAIEDFTKAARIIVGTDSDWVKTCMRECYSPYNRNHEKLIFMDIKSAELTKYAANTMLATKISFMNEISNIAENLGADVESVRKGIGSDPRIGYDFIYPGCGYGGSCFPKDVRALFQTAFQVGYDAELIKAVENVNIRQKNSLFLKLSKIFGEQLSEMTIAIWGLSFKPDTDDMREAPSRTLIEQLWAVGARVQAFDPQAMKEANRIYGERSDFKLVGSRDDAVLGADALVICTEWKTFRAVDFKLLKDQLINPVIVDGRNLFDPEKMTSEGFFYYGVGRGNSVKSKEELQT